MDSPDPWDQVMMYRASEEIIKDGLKSKIKNGEIHTIRDSLLKVKDNKFDQVLLSLKYSELVMRVAIDVGSKDAVETLVKECGVDVDTKIDDRQSAIHYAIKHEQLEIFELLLKLGANINIQNQYLKNTPLSFAAACGKEDFVKILIERGANLNCGTLNNVATGEPPLEEAVLGGNVKLIKLFLDFKCSAKVLKAALSEACRLGDADMVNLILDHPTSIDAKIIDSDVLLSPVRAEETEIVQLLLQRGANINAKGYENNTALLVAAARGCTNLLRLLLHHGANISDVDSNERGALFKAVSEGYQDVAVCLLKRGAVIDQRDEDGYTPLLSAVEQEDLEMTELLLDCNADFNVEDNSGICIMDKVIENIEVHWVPQVHVEFAKFIVMHMVRMRCENLSVSEKNWSASKRNQVLGKFQCDFEREMMALKIAKFTDLGICFYDIVKASSNVQFFDLATNEKVKSLLESREFKLGYPICQELISKRFKKTVEEREFMNQMEYFFFSLAERNDDRLPKLARVCIYKIASYLEDKDKKNLSSIFTVNSV